MSHYDVIRDAARVADERVGQLDRNAMESAELDAARRILERLCDRVGRDDKHWVAYYSIAGMISGFIMDRCPHDPDSHVLDIKLRDTPRGEEFVWVDTYCPACDAKRIDSGSVGEMWKKYGDAVLDALD